MSASVKKVNLDAIPGFPEFTVNEGIIFENLVGKIKEIYGLYGFNPLDTRLVETVEVLNQKGIDSKELFSLGRISQGEDIGGREGRENKRQLALRFDLTVPMARFIAQNHKRLIFPFKRYQIQKVYRAEASKAATGRFNEFYQCDIDVISRNEIDFTYDSEFPAIVFRIFKDIFNLERFVIRISNRKFLEGLFISKGLIHAEKIKRAVKVIDDIEKVEPETTTTRLREIGLSEAAANEILIFFKEVYTRNPSDAIKFIREREFKDPRIIQGIEELEQVVDGIIANGVPQTHFKIDPRIARGLDYYTGTVYETNLLDHMELGSVCSGGRYEDLVSVLSGNKSDQFPGVGLSIGLSRLIPTLIKGGYLGEETGAPVKVLVTCQDPSMINSYQKLGSMLREKGVSCEVYLQRGTKLSKQLDYAHRKGIPFVIISNKAEIEKDQLNLKNMKTGSQNLMTFDSVLLEIV
jgi:histidyl-tRNA synthetase